MRTAVTAFAVAPLLVAASTVTAAYAAPGGHTNHSVKPAAKHPTPSIAKAVRRQVAQHGSANVVVALRGHAATAHPDTRHGAEAHKRAVDAAQSPVLSLLSGSKRATHVHAYRSFNVISARVTQAGLAKLAASKDVAIVAPNATLRLNPTVIQSADTPSRSNVGKTAAAPPTPKSATPTKVPAGVCSATTAQVPEALQTTQTQSDDSDAKTARSLGATGAGVTVAFMAEGIDVNNPEFVRPDGSPVFTDYQDFSGDGTSATTTGGEAFLDATSIAAQGTNSYDVSHATNSPDVGKCKIRVIGVAPGASMVALKVFGNDTASTSGFLEAIDYAVNTDHVNVLNQSFGYNPIPDTTMDVIRQADAAAVAAGTTITVSSGDAGVNNTIGSPATSPGVISVGASTTLRSYLQGGYGLSHVPTVKGYLSNNISALSSSGEDQSGATVNLVAPGDSTWVACTADDQQYSDCAGPHGAADVELSGGTSESAPLTAGAAALVIQAYRQTHNGASPTPAQVKQIIVGTARDISAPADQQGAGELDTYRAVLAARSITGNQVTPSAQGNTFVTDTSQIDVSGATNTPVQQNISVTNTGSATQVITPSTRAIGSYTSFHQQHVVLSKSSPTFTGAGGYQDVYEKVTFTVPAGAARLDAAVAYPGFASNGDSPGELSLVGPKGAYAGNDDPQGVGDYGDVQITRPTAGRWTGYIFTAPAAVGGILGSYQFGFRTAKYATHGTVSAPVTLAPGQSQTITYTSTTPTEPGDKAASVVLASSLGGSTTIPVVLRSLVPVTATSTPSFQGALTGGNGRQGNTGQLQAYQFDVASGTAQLNASITLAKNPLNPFFVSLIDPNGDQVGYGSNVFLSSLSAKPSFELSAVSHVLNPAAGQWSLVVQFSPFVSGDELQQGFTGEVDTAAPRITPTGLPTSTATTLPAGTRSVAYVSVKNTTSEPEAYFADARTNQDTTYTLTGSPAKVTLPTTNDPSWTVPSETSSITASVTSSKPSSFDLFTIPTGGDPDLESNTGTSPSLTYSAPTVTPGSWEIGPALVGPFGATASPHATASATMTATTLGFDRTITSSTHDLWLASVDNSASTVKPVVVQPGKTGVITVNITPTGAAGSTVSGTLYVDSMAAFTPSGVFPSANELASLPYTYKIG